MTRRNFFAPGFIAALGIQFAVAAELPISRPELSPAPAALAQQVQVLQQQVALLQSQVGALLAAVHVSPAGVTLQGPSVTIAGNAVEVTAVNNLSIKSGANTTLLSGGN